DRRADRRELHADLVGAPGLGAGLDEGAGATALEDGDARPRLLRPRARAARILGDHATTLALADRVDQEPARGHAQARRHDREVRLVHLAALELPREAGVRLL